MKYFAKNLRFLREGKNLKQSDIPGFSASQWGNYERELSKPGLDDLLAIAKYFVIDEASLLHVDLSRKGDYSGKTKAPKNTKRGDDKRDYEGDYSIKKYNPGSKNTIASEEGLITRRMPQVVTVDSQGNENVVMVPVRARAGYLNGYADPEFITNLPAYRLPGLNTGSFRLFEVEGLSMYPTLHGSDLVIGSFVDQLRDVRDDRIHVVVTKSAGVVVKRVLNRIQKEGKLILKSDNYKDREMYPSIVCDQQEILEVWYATGFISRQMRPPAETYNRVIDLEGRLTLIEDFLKKGLPK